MPSGGALSTSGEASPAVPFGDRLTSAVAERDSQVVLGIDPDPARLWPEAVESLAESRARLVLALADVERSAALDHGQGGRDARLEAAAAVLGHCLALVDAAGPACVAVKPQLACFERLGFAGWLVLEAVVAHARAQGLLVIADGKRGDIATSATAYGQALLGATETPFGPVPGLGADAATVNPLLGEDALAPLIDIARERGRHRLRPRPHLQSRRRRPVRRRARRRPPAVGADRAPGRRRRRPRAAVGALRRRRRDRRDRPRAPRAAARADAPHAVPAPRHRRPGRRRRRARAGLRPGPRRRPRQRLALDRRRARADRGRRPSTRPAPRPSGCASRRGRWSEASVLSRAIIVPMARSPARFIAPLALVAFGVALFLVLSTALKDDPGTSNSGSPTVVAAVRQGRQEEEGQEEEGAQDLRRQDRRHAVRHRREDRRAAHHHPPAEPGSRPPGPDPGTRAEVAVMA